MNGSYNSILVTFSIIVAIVASFTALDIASSVALARGRARVVGVAAGSVAMGVGIWSMHFVAMLAFRMPGMAIWYQVSLVALSVAVAILAAALALVAVTRDSLTRATLGGAALAMGAAIAGMHYIGMWSMRMPAVIEWRGWLVAASIVIAVAASYAALWLAFRFRFDRSGRAVGIRAAGAVVMGFAISGMHYTAMAAAHFRPVPWNSAMDEPFLLATDDLGVSVAGTTLLILALVMLSSGVGRELGRRRSLAEENAALYAEAEAARVRAETLANQLLSLAAAREQQAAELALLNEELRAAEDRLRGIIDSALDAVVVADVGGVIVEWNRQAEVVFGWTAAEAIGRTLAETIVPERFREMHVQGMHRFVSTGEQRILDRRIEISGLRRDGSEFPIELTITRVGSADHVLFTSFIRDITELRRAQEERRASDRREELLRVMEAERARLAAFFEKAPAFMALLEGPEHVVALRNERFDHLVGGRHVLGTALEETLPELVEHGHVAILDRVFASGETHVSTGARLRIRRQAAGDPEELYINVVYQPVAGPDGSVSGIFVHGVDVTELVRATQAAEAASRAKSEFLSRMSHEFRTPLNAILGFGQLLELELAQAPNRESVDQILKAGRHLLGLIDEVLDISRIEAGQMVLSVEPVRVRSVLQESVDLVRLMAERRGVSIDVAEPGDSQYVAADRQRLQQVMLNLLSNAIKYNRPQGTVTISCEETGERRLRIVVRDTGRGIPAEQLDRLFTPFDRLDANDSEVEGTGLGLALSRGIVQAMGGTLGVESADGGGSRFWVELPLSDPPADGGSAIVRPVATDAPPEHEKTHTVLVVEDNAANVRLMERLFQRRPHVRLLCALTGRRGLELARECRPDLVMLDRNLPDISGDRVLCELRRDPTLAATPVMMVSGDAIPAQVERVMALGADAYITKPFNVHELLRMIDERLDRSAGSG